MTKILDTSRPYGWLVAVEGPHMGKAWMLTQFNFIGRKQTIPIYDDTTPEGIAATIMYAPDQRKFLVSGSDIALLYVNGQSVTGRQELQPNSHLKLGETVVRFVPLCGNDFAW